MRNILLWTSAILLLICFGWEFYLVGFLFKFFKRSFNLGVEAFDAFDNKMNNL